MVKIKLLAGFRRKSSLYYRMLDSDEFEPLIFIPKYSDVIKTKKKTKFEDLFNSSAGKKEQQHQKTTSEGTGSVVYKNTSRRNAVLEKDLSEDIYRLSKMKIFGMDFFTL